MTIAEKHGFTFISVPGDSPIVARFIADHIVRFDLPADSRSSSEHWVAVCKPPGVYALFGWRLLNDTGGLRADVGDFYIYPGKWGVLAAYAAMERIRQMSDQYGVPVLTATPLHNDKMWKAIEKSFGQTEPSHVVHIYFPPKGDT